MEEEVLQEGRRIKVVGEVEKFKGIFYLYILGSGRE